jgi:hypothetical protein
VVSRLAAVTSRRSDPFRAVVDDLLLQDEIFLEWFAAPGLLSAIRQVMGAQPYLMEVKATIGVPQADQRLADPQLWGWHRGMRPKWLLAPCDDNVSLLNAAWVNTITFLNDVGDLSGGTPVLDGSHTVDRTWEGWYRTGDYRELRQICPLLITTASAGSVLIFAESLFHAVPPVLSGKPAYKLVYGFWPSWWSRESRGVPESFSHKLSDSAVRNVLGPTPMLGQGPLTYEEETARIKNRKRLRGDIH